MRMPYRLYAYIVVSYIKPAIVQYNLIRINNGVFTANTRQRFFSDRPDLRKKRGKKTFFIFLNVTVIFYSGYGRRFEFKKRQKD